MRDFISKGTGNSRYLKSAISAGTTHEELVEMLRNGTFPVDLAGLNPEGYTQLGDFLNKVTLLSDNVAARYRTPVPTLENIAVGTTVKITVSGADRDFLVVQKGRPDTTLYDSSCDGVWLLQKDIYDLKRMNATNANDYANSEIKTWLSADYINQFETSIKNTIKQVKIPYRPGTSGTTVNGGANGLSVKAFLLSRLEVGLTQSAPIIDGAVLDYFQGTAANASDTKRVAYRSSGTASSTWYTRSPAGGSTNYYVFINGSGYYSSTLPGNVQGIRPCIILPYTTSVYGGKVYASYTITPDLPTDVYPAILSALGKTTGNGAAYNLTAPGFTLTDGATVRFKLHVDSVSGATLNVNGTGAKKIMASTKKGLKAGTPKGSWQIATYCEDFDFFLLRGSPAPDRYGNDPGQISTYELAMHGFNPYYGRR